MSGGQYPTWRLMAGNYLAVMASSVASERAFSAAGITISKRRNRLDGDIVEALQCLKSLNSQDLMSRALPNIAEEEKFLDDVDQQPANQQGTTIEVVNDEDWTLDTHVDDTHVEDADDDDNDGNVGM